MLHAQSFGIAIIQKIYDKNLDDETKTKITWHQYSWIMLNFYLTIYFKAIVEKQIPVKKPWNLHTYHTVYHSFEWKNFLVPETSILRNFALTCENFVNNAKIHKIYLVQLGKSLTMVLLLCRRKKRLDTISWRQEIDIWCTFDVFSVLQGNMCAVVRFVCNFDARKNIQAPFRCNFCVGTGFCQHFYLL